MIRSLLTCLIFAILTAGAANAQSDLQQIVDADRTLASIILAKSEKEGYLASLAVDGIVFRPEAVNGREWWDLQTADSDSNLERTMAFADISSNGLLGYTTGTWIRSSKLPGGERSLGQYVTIWSKKPDEGFKVVLDLATAYDEATPPIDNPVLPTNFERDLNPRRWSAADPSMNFFKKGMGKGGLGGAFDDHASADVRVLIEENPPILGKKNAVKAMKRYVAVAYPKKVSLLEAADLAYIWNPCDYANSDEGMERGTCLNVWKLRDKKWYITLGVYARIPNISKPTIKISPRNRDQAVQ